MNTLKELRQFIFLWLTQSFSALGSAMTNFALVIWLYEDSGSALATALLTVCSYAPYVLMSIFAGAVSDKWDKKTVMLVCDSFAAACTVIVFILFSTDSLEAWHLYILNALNGLMNSVQSPASDVAVTLLTPEKHYQKASAMRSLSNSLVSILTPVLATAAAAFAGVRVVIFFDLITFAAAFLVLLLFIKIPEVQKTPDRDETLLQSVKSGLVYLRANKGILWIILFFAAINLIASICDAAFAPMLLSRSDETALGTVTACVGIATLAGSIIAVFFPEPRSRVRLICNCLLLSMSTENFLLAFSDSVVVWCIGAALGWIAIPLMNANLDVVFRTKIPAEMQGRVYAARNTFQFFTIPVGYLLGGLLVDEIFEPFMAKTDNTLLLNVFGTEKGSGAAFLFAVIGIAGVAVCLIFRKIKHIKELE